jgi:hypothetical protein
MFVLNVCKGYSARSAFAAVGTDLVSAALDPMILGRTFH